MEHNKTKMLFSLLSCINKDKQTQMPREVTEDEFGKLFLLATKHDLSHILAYALYENGAVDKEHALYEQVQREQIQAIWRYEQNQMVLDEIKEVFEGEKIDFVPLKGSVIRGFYAEPWLRTSCDIDVLVHEQELERATSLLEARGYVEKGKNFHDVSLFSPSGVHLELHYNITENIENIDRVLRTVWDHCERADGMVYEYRQSPEFLMYHILAHMSYHFISGGCGIRPFLDVWLLRDALEYDEKKLIELCKQAELETFRQNVYSVIDVWMEGREHNALTARIESFIFGGGVYGTTSNRVILEQAQSGGKTRNLLFRLFMPYSLMRERYPILKKHKVLMPVFWVVRWVQTLSKKRFRRSVNELVANRGNSADDIKAASRFLAEVGLNPKNR